MLTLIGLGLCFYFCYHLICGGRGYVRYLSLGADNAALSLEAQGLQAKRTALEDKVAMLRPNSINKDLLEERARIVLGFRRADERDILISPSK